MGTALVRIEGARLEKVTRPMGWRANADFVTHLIATALHAPQTRVRRRAEPENALAAYRALGQWPSLPGRAFSKSL